MGLDSHSKHGVLIGCISIIIYSFVSLQSLLQMKVLYSYRSHLDGQSILKPTATLISSILMIIFSGLMIYGIVKLVCFLTLLLVSLLLALKQWKGPKGPITNCMVFFLMGCVLIALIVNFRLYKKRSTFMTPWLLSGIVGVCYEILCVGFFINGLVLREIGVIFSIIISLGVLMIYPIYNLYSDIRSESAAKSLKE